jgi:superfamily II DNA helicase RecQ
MIKTNPQNLEEMKKVSGVGDSKIKAYGQIFLEILSN